MLYHNPFSFRNLPPAIKRLLIANGTFFVIQQFLGYWFSLTFGLVPEKVLMRFHLWQPFTYLFLHGSFFHLFFNLFALWMFGKELEYQWGTREFVKFYFTCGVGAGLIHILFEPFLSLPVIGASGAIYGILVAYAISFPDSVIYLYGLLPIRARQFVILIGAIEFLAAFGHAPSTVARFAHLGGMVIGYLYLKSYEFRSILNQFLHKLLDLFLERAPKKRNSSSSPKSKKMGKDELAKEVDRILEKVLLQGADSLTEEEREIMRRYSSSKNRS